MEARKYLEDALDIVRRVEDREEEGKVLNGLSLVYDDLGKRDQAKTYLDQALTINQEIANRWEQSRQRLVGYLVGHPVRIAMVVTVFAAILMVPVLIVLVSPKIRGAMSIVAAITLTVCFLLIVVSLRGISTRA